MYNTYQRILELKFLRVIESAVLSIVDPAISTISLRPHNIGKWSTNIWYPSTSCPNKLSSGVHDYQSLSKFMLHLSLCSLCYVMVLMGFVRYYQGYPVAITIIANIHEYNMYNHPLSLISNIPLEYPADLVLFPL